MPTEWQYFRPDHWAHKTAGRRRAYTQGDDRQTVLTAEGTRIHIHRVNQESVVARDTQSVQRLRPLKRIHLLKDPGRPIDRLVVEARQRQTLKLTLTRDARRLLGLKVSSDCPFEGVLTLALISTSQRQAYTDFTFLPPGWTLLVNDADSRPVRLCHCWLPSVHVHHLQRPLQQRH